MNYGNASPAGLVPATVHGEHHMEIRYLLAPLVKSMTAVENARDATLREVRANPLALHNLKSEVANMEHELAIYKREIARHEDAADSESAALRSGL